MEVEENEEERKKERERQRESSIVPERSYITLPVSYLISNNFDSVLALRRVDVDRWRHLDKLTISAEINRSKHLKDQKPDTHQLVDFDEHPPCNAFQVHLRFQNSTIINTNAVVTHGTNLL